MAEPTPEVANDAIERRADVEEDDKPQSSKFWLGEITAAKKRDKPWIGRAEKVIARYRDERGLDRNANSDRRANILWSNTETLKSTLFQGVGNPDVRRRFPKKGEVDRVARQAALVLERSLSYCSDAYDADSQVEACVEDNLLPGRGTAWIVYDAQVTEGYGAEEEGAPVNEDPQEGEGAPQISSQSVRIEHVFWKDFLTSAGRKWSDVWWAARSHDYSRDELTKFFPKHADEIPLDISVAGYEPGKAKGKDEEDTFQRARVWEIWDKSKKTRVYVAEGYDLILKQDQDPYQLKDFFPTVEPLYGVKTTSSLTPIPEYTLYQDQAEELDLITTRISRLVNALKRRGVYDGSIEGPENQLSQLAYADDNQFFPVKNFAALMEKGGLANVFQSENVEPIGKIVQSLYEQRQMLMQTIYEITGISDILRGASDPSETATAQKIKGQFGSLRLQKRQKRIQTFCRDLYRLKAELIAEHFTREQLQEMTGIDMPLKAEQEQAKMMLASIQQRQQPSPMGHNGGPPMPPQEPAPVGPGPGGRPPMMGGAQQPMPPPPGAPGQHIMPPMRPDGQQGPGPQMMNGGQQQVSTAPPPGVSPAVMQKLLDTAKAVSWEEIAAILRSDQRRGYRVDIETDATNAMDSETEKAQRMEFLTAMGQMFEQALPFIMANPIPALVTLAKENAKFAVGAFKAGRTMEETYEDAFDQLESMAKQNAASGPKMDPEEKKVMLEAKSRQMEFEFKAKESEQSRQMELAKAQQDAQIKQQELEHSAKLEQFKAENEARLAEQKQQHEMQLANQAAQQDAAMREHEMAAKAHEMDMNARHQEREFGLKEQQFGHQREMEASKLGIEQQKFGFDQDKYSNELLASNAPTADGTSPQQSSLGQLLEMLMQAQQQQAQMFSAALQQIAEQNAQAIKVATAPRRAVRDPQSGRVSGVEVVMQ